MKQSDLDVERSVLGMLMTFEEYADKVLLLSDDDFVYKEHSAIFKSIYNQYSHSHKFDYITVASECGSEYRTEIQNCVQIAVSATLFDEHFTILKSMASQRRLIAGFNNLTYDGEVTVSSVQKMIDDESGKQLTADVNQKNEHNINEFVKNLNAKKGSLLTGFNSIDKTLGGIRKGTVFIIGARPSTGKTSFALNIASNQIGQGKKSMFFSLEMSSEMIYERVMAAKHQIDYEKFTLNQLSDNEIETITADTETLKADKNFIVIDDVYNAEFICNLIVENKPNLAVVDFMQIILTTGKFQDPRTKIDYISSLFKRTAKSTGCSIIVLSQLSRAGKDAPTMSDLKESGGLEQDGDYIALLHRPFVLNKADADITPEQTSLLLDKNKFGKTGKVELHFDLKHQRFYEIEHWKESKIDYSGNPFIEDEI